jgi:hypothetical protein
MQLGQQFPDPLFAMSAFLHICRKPLIRVIFAALVPSGTFSSLPFLVPPQIKPFLPVILFKP